MSKNIVVFSDGTGQEGGEGNNTNVYNLFNMVEDRTASQVAFYDRGLGTGWRKITGNGAGVGISENIIDCYEFIFENYQAGDKIYLFGFSRGAFTVRSLSGFINLFGILPKSRPELIKTAYKIYKIKDRDKRKKKVEEFLSKHHNHWCDIEFIGVWDTVGALGIPIKALDVIVDRITPFVHSFHDTKLCKSVKYGCHAISIDDERLTFHPTLWDENDPQTAQRVEQVWFAGVHTDVGGGYEEHGLADITLDWMVKKATGKGLLIYPKHKIETAPNVDDKMHDSREGIRAMFRKKSRSEAEALVKDKKLKTIVVHQSVLDRTLDKNGQPGGYKPWILEHEYEVEPW